MEEEIVIIEDDIEEELIIVEEAIEYITPTTQEKTITPTKEEQIVLPDGDIFALSKVTVEKIPDEYIVPRGTLDISENGTYDVTEKTSANVNVQPPLQAKATTENGTITPDKDYYGLSSVEVNVPVYTLGTKRITANGVYNATDDGLDGYSKVEVETSGADLNEYFNTTITNSNASNYYRDKMLKKIPTITVDKSTTTLGTSFSYCPVSEINIIGDTSNVTSMYQAYYYAGIKKAPLIDTSNVTTFYQCHNYNTKLEELPLYDMGNNTSLQNYCANSSKIKIFPKYNTSKVTTFQYMLNGCTGLERIEEIDGSSAINVSYCFSNLAGARNLTYFGGFKNLGMAYLTTTGANNTYYGLDLYYCNYLTHESLMNVINGLYDIASKGCNTQQLKLHTTQRALLSDEDIAIATNKGWTVV